MALGNAYWNQASWFIDPANSSGLASDGNTGLDATHPLLTWAEFRARMGTSEPILAATVTITLMSSGVATDPLDFSPVTTSGFPTIVFIVGVLAVKVAAGTIINGAALVPKNRGPATGGPANGQLLAVTVSGAAIGNIAAGDFLQNTTHPSNAWAFKNVAGNQWSVSQPCAPLSTSVFAITEVDTWATGDTVQVSTLPKLFVNKRLRNVVAINIDINSTGGFASLDLNNSQFSECRVTTFLGGGAGFQLPSAFNNCDLLGGTPRYAGPLANIGAGQARTAFNLGAGSTVSFDHIMGAAGPVYSASLIFSGACLYLDPATELILFTGISSTAGAPIIWGGGAIEIAGAAMAIAVGAGAPQAQFQVQGGAAGFLAMDGGSTNGYAVETTGVISASRPLTAANLDATIGAGGFRNAAGQVAAVGQDFGGRVRSGAV